MSVQDEVLFVRDRFLLRRFNLVMDIPCTLDVCLLDEQRQRNAFPADSPLHRYGNIDVVEGDQLSALPAHCLRVSIPCYAIPNRLDHPGRKGGFLPLLPKLSKEASRACHIHF